MVTRVPLPVVRGLHSLDAQIEEAARKRPHAVQFVEFQLALAMEEKRACKRRLRSQSQRNPDHALDGADHATDHATNGATYNSASDGADRTEDLLTRDDAYLASADDALCMSGDGCRKRDNDTGQGEL
jgi:hypothetical protein